MKMTASTRSGHRAWLAAAALVCAAALWIGHDTAQAQSRGQLAEGVAAIVNDQAITSFDVRQRTQFLLATAGAGQITEELVQRAAAQALNSLINERLQIQEAGRFKQSMSDAEVDRVLTRQAQQSGATLDAFFADLRQIGVSATAFREKTRAEVLWQRIVSGRFGNRVRISPERVNEAMARIMASVDKQQFLVSEIFLEAETPEEQAEARTGAATLVNQMRAGASFAAVAQQFSFAPSAATGGDLGWITLGELRPEVASVVERLEPGSVSDPIPVTGGFMIMGVRERRDPRPADVKLTLKEMTRPVPQGATEAVWRRAEQAATAARNAVRNGCEGVARAAQRNSVDVVDLPDFAQADLAEPFRSQAGSLSVGGVSAPFRSERGVHVLVLCNRELAGSDLPSRDQLEDRLYEQELSLIARRYLRDLRREAAIVTR